MRWMVLFLTSSVFIIRTTISLNQVTKSNQDHNNLIKRNPLPYNHLKFNTRTTETDLTANSLAGGSGEFEHSRHELFSIVPEVSATHLGLSLVPAFIVLFGLFSAFVKEKLYAGEAIIALIIGIILGPQVTGLFDPRSWGGGSNFNELTLELTRIVIALSVFAVGVELPKAYILKHWKSLLILIGPLMLVGWMVTGLLIYLLIPGLNFLESLVVAAAVTPTDPILAASVVGKGKFAQKHVPAHLRHLLQAESGCNDGAAFPFLYLAMFLALRGDHSIKKVVGEWIILVLLYQILLGVIIGAVIGILARKTLKFCKRRSYIDRESMVAMYVALALLTTGVTTLAGSDDLLAAFACGTAFAWDDWFTESIEASNFSSIIDLLINCATFVYVGATIPFSAWNDSSITLVPWRIVVLAILVMVLRRLPAMLLFQALIPDLKTTREAVFSGHFGPIGVGAIFISTLATIKLPTPHIPPQTSLDTLALTVQPLIYLFVLFSVLVHGLSIPFFTLGRNVHSRVHSMTRTWTQASGNEPSWLNRVKRVDRTADGEAVVDGRPVSGFISRPDPNLDLEKQDLDPTPPPPVKPNHLPDIPPNDDPCEGTLRNEDRTYFIPEPEPIRRPSLSHAFNFTNLSLAGRSTLLGFHRRTSEEEQARKQEKMIRDEWCRKERMDVVKKGEERIYRSGRHIIIERGDGDEVEVIDADPTKAAVERAKQDPKLGLIHVSASRLKTELKAMEQEGISSASRRIEALKRVVNKRLHYHPHKQEEGSSGMPGPGQGPQSSKAVNGEGESLSTAVEDQVNRGSKAASIHSSLEGVREDEEIWVEGDQIVVESGDGESVHVFSLPKDMPNRSRPTTGSRSRHATETRSRRSTPEIRELEEPDLTEVNREPEIRPSDLSEVARDSTPPSPQIRVTDLAVPQAGPSEGAGDEDEWEEEEEEEEEEEQQQESSTHQRCRGQLHRHKPIVAHNNRPRSIKRHSSRKNNQTIYYSHLNGSKLDNLEEIENDHLHQRQLVPPNDQNQDNGISRSSSPSRSIRFADITRPNRTKKPKKSKLGLLKNFN
ncbi:hypothetical protein CROQUDRAFT_659971 [Cronartium quercuum f. sp. fusiforme G11]|uniref:Cation/H+ exchanger transmembrane domain-containing protein n=1 Tax=Cronartium quercuum f. sp. fusiforme G11 TaxID=708437 RepID=A0A9P6NIY4_9BASI|nr:hypothetical protein CROQUDRAFT_659971 [Cronartium quercuum f. sp. fusiforme G11]